ncbi:MAG: NADH-quinone oxidoreductase subunit L [Gemmatimonadaceae bacterium]
MILQHASGGGGHPLSGTIAEYVWLLPVLPLIGFVVNGLLSLAASYRAGPADPSSGNDPSHSTHGTDHGAGHDHTAIMPRHRFAGVVSIVGPGVLVLSFALAVMMFRAMIAAGELHTPFVSTIASWMPASAGLRIDWAFQLDQLSMVMVLVVTGVGALIHVFSVGYMRDDPGYPRYFAYLNLFISFMLVLVLGASYPVLFVGWEGVGLCSYLLIGFWFSEKANADAGKKAFIVNRIGDFGFLIAMFLLWVNVGALDFVGVEQAADSFVYGGTLISAICLFFFLGCAGKSAQIPLYVWLPDAMAGPTPVSALIHAATMVTAGVYLIARSSFLFALAPVAGLTVALVGAVTALFAATIGLKQWDIKKVLAYSTVSQLGYMFVAVGVGAYVAGIFHLVTHAFFKALLFLGSGSVIFAMHRAYHHTHRHEDAQDMRNMGGLRSHMRLTWVLMWIATLAIAGIPFFAGFFSKDEIIASVFARMRESSLAEVQWLGISGSVILHVVYAMTLIAALLTAIYMTRMMLYTFHGPNRTGDEERKHLAEAPWVMSAPLVVLGVLTVAGGWFNLPAITSFLGPTHALGHWLEPTVGESALRAAGGAVPEMSHSTELLLIGVAVGIAVLGIVVALVRLKPARLVPKDQAPEESGIERVLANKYYVDEAYDRIVVNPTVGVSRGFLWRFVDQGIIDGLFVNGSAWIARAFGKGGSLLQTGQVGAYAWGIVIGVLAVLGAFTLR